MVVGAAIVFGAMLLLWAAMAIVARRMAPGTLKDLASVLPACVTLVRRLAIPVFPGAPSWP